MYKPPHPGEVLFNLYIEGAGISISHLARHIGVDRKTVSRIVNGRTHITTEMAIRLSKAFDTTPQMWLNMQNQHDLWNASKDITIPKIEFIRHVD